MCAFRNCKIKCSLCFLLWYIASQKMYFSVFQLSYFLLSSQSLILVLICKKMQGVQDPKWLKVISPYYRWLLIYLVAVLLVQTVKQQPGIDYHWLVITVDYIGFVSLGMFFRKYNGWCLEHLLNLLPTPELHSKDSTHNYQLERQHHLAVQQYFQ